MPLPSTYYQYFKISDYKPYFRDNEDAVRTCLGRAVDCTNKQSSDIVTDSGVTYVMFDDIKDVEMIPSYIDTYWLDGVEVDRDTCEDALCCEIVTKTVHHVDWTKGLNLEDNHRLVFVFLPKGASMVEYINQVQVSCGDTDTKWKGMIAYNNKGDN